MYYIEKEYKSQHFKSKAFDLYFSGLRIGALDIETTGLNPSSTCFILGGLLTLTEDGVLVRQYFAEHPSLEKETLTAYLEEVEKLDLVITYNGKHFDLPFLEKRCQLLRLPAPKLPFNLDLYLVLNGHSDLRSFLPNLKQKTVETFMGLWQREDEITGAESVQLYKQYVGNKNPALLEKILLHNDNDLQQFHKLLPVIQKSNFHRAMHTLGFPAGSCRVSCVEFKKDLLRIVGKHSLPMDYCQFSTPETPYTVLFDQFSGDFEFLLPLLRKDGLAFLDLKLFSGDFSALKIYPEWEEDCLAIQIKNDVNYLVLNHFIKLIIENFLEGNAE